jgi:hypothetical protein
LSNDYYNLPSFFDLVGSEKEEEAKKKVLDELIEKVCVCST